MSNIKVKINGNIVIYFEEKTYKSTIQDIREDCMLINIPIGDGAYLDFEKDQEVDMNYYFKNSYYTFKTKVVGREKENQLILYKVQLPYDVIKIQRRDYVRVDLIDYVFLRTLEEDKWSKALILDLSGGGMRMSVIDEFYEGDKILIKLLLDGVEIKVNGEIIREIERRGNNQIYGVKFIDIPEIARDRIIKKVFSQMIKQREVV